MAQPNEMTYRLITVLDASDAPVTGLTLASFTRTAWARGYGASIFTAYTDGAVLQELGGGDYDLAFLTPPTAGWARFRIKPNNAAYTAFNNIWEGEVEPQDLGSIYASVLQPVATLSQSAQLGMPLAMEIQPYRFRTMAITVRDSLGAIVPLDGTKYANWAVSIRSKDQVTTRWDGTNGSPTGFAVSGDINGILSITWPESVVGPVYTTWATLRTYKLGDFVVPTTSNGYIYQCTAAGTVAAGEPAWPTTPGNTVVNGTVTWTCLAKTIWSATTAKVVGDTVTPAAGGGNKQFRCTVAGTTSGAEPTWAGATTPGSLIVDGTVTWQLQSDWYAVIAAAIAAGQNSAGLYIEVCADYLLNTAQTQAIIRSSDVTVPRREVGS